MRRLSRSAVLLGASGAFLTFTYVLAQEPKAEPPRATEEVKTETVNQVVEKTAKIGDAKDEAEKQPKVEGKKAAVKKRAQPAAKVEARVVVANVDPQVQQWVQQFRPILKAELHFIRMVCGLTKEQTRKLVRDEDKTLQDAAKRYVNLQQAIMRRPRGAAFPDPRKLVRDSLADDLKKRLSPEQMTLYQAETEKRLAYRKDVAIRNLVATLDQVLILNAEQRDKIQESLTSHWSDAWCQSLQMFMYGEQFFPNIPSQYITPFLNKTQSQVWRGIPKNQGMFWGGFGMGGGMLDEDVVEAKEPGGAVELRRVIGPAGATEIRIEVR